ncbi:MAG: dihydrodipicolinate synthase family protein [Clostridia bacterium]|nr:dihydrodipicolinate synthase family protein [Clostridia bacterium]
MKKFTGIIIPVTTPFEKDGSINFDNLRYNIRKWNQTDVIGYMCLGSNGEFKALSDEESYEVVKTVIEEKGDKCLIVGAGRESVPQTLEFINKLLPLKDAIDYVSIITPNYFPKLIDDKVIENFYTSIADKSPLPVLLYTAPSYNNNVGISPAIAKKLADHPNIYGMKDTSSNMMAEYVEAVGGRDDFMLIAGSINNLILCLKGGGTAGVVSAANYFPNESAEIVTLFMDGKEQEAEEKQIALRALLKETGAKYGVQGVKACMNLLGWKAGSPRAPYLPLEGEELEGVRQAFIDNKIL